MLISRPLVWGCFDPTNAVSERKQQNNNNNKVKIVYLWATVPEWLLLFISWHENACSGNRSQKLNPRKRSLNRTLQLAASLQMSEHLMFVSALLFVLLLGSLVRKYCSAWGILIGTPGDHIKQASHSSFCWMLVSLSDLMIFPSYHYLFFFLEASQQKIGSV